MTFKMKKYLAPRLFQYDESNHPFYKKGFELINAAHFSKSGILYDDWYGRARQGAIRNNSTHGRCPGGRKSKPYYCVHCQTIEAATKAVEEGPLFL